MVTFHGDQSSSENSTYLKAFEQYTHFNHPFHPSHPLIRQSSLKKYWCASCHKCFENEHYYCCSECNFAMDVKCVFMEPIEFSEGDPHIQHVTHQHPMPLVKITPNDQVICFACQSLCLGTSLAYACAACNYFLHKRCAECPVISAKVTDLSPPDEYIAGHIRIDHEKRFSCHRCMRNNACFKIFSDDFSPRYICIDCYILPSHLNTYNFHSAHDCCRLSKLIDQYLPRLPQLLDQYLPQFLNKYLSKILDQHSPNLILSISKTKHADRREDVQCRICHIRFRKDAVPCYECTACGFVIDVECALTPPMILEGKEYYRHFNHPHPMILLIHLAKNDEDHEEVDKYCSACDSPCSGLVYSCTKCKYFLHKSCALLPLRLVSTHPLHKHSLLTQLPHTILANSRMFCSLCYKKNCGFLFECPHHFSYDSKRLRETCNFKICGRCILGRPNIKYEGHEHLLYLVEKVHGDTYIECNPYDGYCKLPATSVELRRAESSMFRCVNCDHFNLNFLCGPLPRSIKYKYHIHSLILVDSVMENDSDGHYCDICESERNPQICVYYCQECEYIAHVHCLKSEVMAVLKGDLRDVELKTVRIQNTNVEKKIHEASRRRKVEGDVYNLSNIIDNLPENEAIVLQCDFDWPILRWKYDANPPWIRKLYRFNTQYFEKFFDWLDGVCYLGRLELGRKFSSEEEIVIVEGYMVHRTFARILVLLLRKYGDVSTSSQSTPEMKSITYCFLCQVIHSMRRTKVRDITKHCLKEWYFFLKYARSRGFKIQFMFDHLRDVVRAFIALQAITEATNVPIKHVEARNFQRLQEELASSLKSPRDSNFIECVQFIIECLSIALKLGVDNYVANTLL